MKTISPRSIYIVLTAVVLLAIPGPGQVGAQSRLQPVPVNQRQLFNQLQRQLEMFADLTRNAVKVNQPPDVILWHEFERICMSFERLESSLAPIQLDRGANDLADLNAGLDIIAEAFPNFQKDLDRGRPVPEAVRTLCQVLRDAMKLWGQQLSRVAHRLQIGR